MAGIGGRDIGILAAAALLACWLGGCATTPTPEMLAANDPFEPTNRETLKLNGKIDKYFVIPTVGAYFFIVPDGGRRAIHNFLQNVSLPTVFVNRSEERRVGKECRSWVVTYH